jgi:hypothetical protein
MVAGTLVEFIAIGNRMFRSRFDWSIVSLIDLNRCTESINL